MARSARHKSTEAAFYHLTNRVAGRTDWFPFKNDQARRKLLDMMLFYVNAYRCRLAAFEIMGNHFHFVVHFEKPRALSRDELMDSAHKLYGRQAEKKTADWTVAQWEAFNQRLFDVSKLMQNVNGLYALWFNRTFERRGHFWSNRFKNPELLGSEAVQDAILYVELNAVRAGLVKRPEQWKCGSARWRLTGEDQDLIPLEELFPSDAGTDLYSSYRARLYYRGAVPTREGPGRDPPVDSPSGAATWIHPCRSFSPSFAISDGRIGRRAGREGGATAGDLSAARSISTSPTPHPPTGRSAVFPAGATLERVRHVDSPDLQPSILPLWHRTAQVTGTTQ